MTNAEAELLKQMIESQHGGTATFVRSVKLLTPPRQANWDGLVHVYDLKHHPAAKQAYAWLVSIENSSNPRCFAVLHGGSVTGPTEAVKAAATAIRKQIGKRGDRNTATRLP